MKIIDRTGALGFGSRFREAKLQFTGMLRRRAGKIKGNGATVVWDLSGVKAGTYQIVTRIDEGIGFGQSRVDDIKVVECQEC